jgi:predicted anti-sigma-YlaC factor YlaD
MTMTCERCREQAIDHHYGELPLPETRAVAEHLADCASCALAYCRLSAALAGFRDLDREAPRPEVHRELRAKVEREFRPSMVTRVARLLAVRVPLYQPALVVILLFVLWSLVRGISSKEPHAPTVVERFDAARVEIVYQHVL